MINRRRTRTVDVGNMKIGGDSQISIQSMCNTKISDIDATLDQIARLKEAGCEIVRLAIPTLKDVEHLRKIREKTDIPLVADIHFDHRIAIASAPYVDKLRINPGNIGDDTKVRLVVEAAKKYSLPIRIGVNGGSLKKELVTKHGNTPEAMVESAMENIRLLEKNDFFDIIVSLKASDVQKTVRAYELLAEKVEYPFHIGITEAGTKESGTIKSSVGLGILLAKGFGDTLRVSLTADPVEEVKVARGILQTLGLRRYGREIVSCPTCGRTEIDLVRLASEVEKATENIKRPIKIAVMGCVVNGPGEASDADIAVVGTKDAGFICRKGRLIRKVQENMIIDELLKEIDTTK